MAFKIYTLDPEALQLTTNNNWSLERTIFVELVQYGYGSEFVNYPLVQRVVLVAKVTVGSQIVYNI